MESQLHWNPTLLAFKSQFYDVFSMSRIRLVLTDAEEAFVKRRIASGWAETPDEVMRQAILWLKWSDEHDKWCPYRRKL